MTRLIDCVFIGMITKDLLLFVNEPPQSDKRIGVTEYLNTVGGPSYTAGLACAELGSSAAFITLIGDDADGQEVIAAANRQPFTVVHHKTVFKGRTPFSAILIEDNGKRLIANNHGCIEELRYDSIPIELIQHAKYIHLGGLLSKNVTAIARFCSENSNAMISFDGGNYASEILDSAAPYTNVMILDDKTIIKSYGFEPVEACRHFSGLGIPIVGITMGDKGSLFCCQDRFIFGTPLKIKSVDTTGAGDNFHGAFIYGLRQNMPLEECIRFSNAYAGLCCEGFGGHPRHIERSEAEMRAKEIEIRYPNL